MMNESSWHAMMGISKLLLRNLIVGILVLLITTCAVLAVTLHNVHDKNDREKRMMEVQHRIELIKCTENARTISEEKNAEYKQLFKETIENIHKTEEEIKKWKQLYQRKK